jgi:hypothetical protein
MVKDDEEYLPEKNSLRFNIRLSIRHPTIDPDVITRTLQLTPTRFTMVGSERKTPRGDVLPGRHRASIWSHSFRIERSRPFFRDVVEVINRLEQHKTFLAELDHSGGSITIIVHLPGDTNIGDNLPWQEMARLGALRITLGVEVFPEFN